MVERLAHLQTAGKGDEGGPIGGVGKLGSGCAAVCLVAAGSSAAPTPLHCAPTNVAPVLTAKACANIRRFIMLQTPYAILGFTAGDPSDCRLGAGGPSNCGRFYTIRRWMSATFAL